MDFGDDFLGGGVTDAREVAPEPLVRVGALLGPCFRSSGGEGGGEPTPRCRPSMAGLKQRPAASKTWSPSSYKSQSVHSLMCGKMDAPI
mmetsp:Transcript_57784/g.135673  ORF Transcript_57784/g.135673 Transcript_57784/m.135673 type:complete len:89 (+) Transcript_57784:499-765(+)